MREKRLEERGNSSDLRKSRKKRYKEMSQMGILGSRDLEKYTQMYYFLSNRRDMFIFPNVDSNENPLREDYEVLKKVYNN